jgi:tetratricopeptide (TPR) repeat protein
LRFLELAKEALNESLAIENTFEAHVVLAELLTEDMEDHLDEAEEHLNQAEDLSSGPADEANIEIHLGKIDTEREQDEDALLHYQRATELEPNFAPAWFNLAAAYSRLDNVAEAKKSYQRAIELQPDDINLYVQLSFLYKSEHQDEMAIEVLKEGLSANPDAAELCIALSTFYMTIDDYEQAEEYLDKAEQIDPDAVMVEMMRPMLKSMRTLYTSNTSRRTGQNGDEAKPARQVVESIPADRDRDHTSKPFQPSHPKKKRKKR